MVGCAATSDTEISGYTPADYITYSEDPEHACRHAAEVVVAAPPDVCFALWNDWQRLVDFLDLIGQVRDAMGCAHAACQALEPQPRGGTGVATLRPAGAAARVLAERAWSTLMLKPEFDSVCRSRWWPAGRSRPCRRSPALHTAPHGLSSPRALRRPRPPDACSDRRVRPLAAHSRLAWTTSRRTWRCSSVTTDGVRAGAGAGATCARTSARRRGC